MKKIALTTLVLGFAASSLFAEATLDEDNINQITAVLEGQGFVVQEVIVEDGQYKVATEKDGAPVTVFVSETFEIVSTDPAM